MLDPRGLVPSSRIVCMRCDLPDYPNSRIPKQTSSFQFPGARLHFPKFKFRNPNSANWISSSDFQVSGCSQSEVGSRIPISGSWNFPIPEVGFRTSNYHLPAVGIWIPMSGSWMFDFGWLVWTRHLNTFSTQKTCRKTWKNGCFQGGKAPGRHTRGNP